MNNFNDRDGKLEVPTYRTTNDPKVRQESARALRNYIVRACLLGRTEEHIANELMMCFWPESIIVTYLKHFYTTKAGKIDSRKDLTDNDDGDKHLTDETTIGRSTLKQQKMRSLVVFGLLFAIAGAFFLLREPTITGFTVLDNQMIFAENTTLDLGMDVTSLRISGTVKGPGTARVYLGELLVGEFILSQSNGTLPVPGLLNVTMNVTVNLTNESITNDSAVTILEVSEIDATNNSETVATNDSVPAVNETTVDILPIETIIEFSELCVETCENISASAMRFEIDGTVLTITRFNYTVKIAPLPEINVTINDTINGTNGTHKSILPSIALKNRRNIDAGQVVMKNNTDGTFDIEMRTRPAGGVGLALSGSNVLLRGVRDTASITAKIDDYIGEEPREGRITTDVVAASNITLNNATVRLMKGGEVNAIVKCGNFDIETFLCGAWEKTDIAFVDLGDVIEFTVTGFSGYAGAQLSVINVQSYPALGGNWTVLFNTTGAANLTIAAVNGTTWGNNEDVGDLRFIEVRCGDVVQSYQWIDNAVFIANYSCAADSSEVSKTLTEGKHNLMFTFGSDVDFAFNDVNTKPSLSNVVINTTDWTTNSSDTNLTLNFTATDTEGDRLKNITVWYVNATSLAALFMPFENGSSNASNATFARDYSFFGNNGTVVGATIQPTGGYDGYSAYSFDGSNDYITSSLPEIGSDGFTIEFRALPRANLSYANLSGDMCVVDISVVRVCFTRDGYVEASVTGDDTDATWNNSGALGTNTDLYAFAVWNGSLYAAMGGSNGANISRYDGIVNWTSVGQLNTGGNANALAVFNNTLYAGEDGIGSTGRVFHYDGGTTWTSTGTVIGGASTVDALVTWNGSLYAAVSSGAAGVARYDAGPTWTDISGFSGQSPRTMIVWNGSLFAGMSNGKTYRYNSSNTWISLGSPGSTGQLDSFVVWNGSLYANGYDGATANQSVFQYNGTDGSNNNWTWLGQFQSGSGSSNIGSFAVYNKTLFAGGSSSGVLFSWNGTNWPIIQIGGGVGGNVRALAVWNGSLWAGTSVAGGTITIFRYGNGTALRSTGKLWDGGWQHIVMTRNTTDVGLYINGVLNTSLFIAPNLPLFSAFPTQPLHIGRSWGSSAGEWTSGNDYNGTIDELRIYNRSLTPRQIGALFNNLTHVIDSNETAIGEVWNACVTVNDGTDDGPTVCSNNVTILGGEVTPPAVTSLLPAQNSEYNVSMNIEIAATVTDAQSTVSMVLANITLPNASAQLVTLSNGTAHPTKYNASYTIPRAAGLYNVTIVANDTNLNYNNTQQTNFTVGNLKPIMNNASLNTTDITTNNTDVNLTLYINASDPDGSGMKNITDWRVGGSSIAVLNMPFESGQNSSNSTFTRDYSSYGNNGTVNGATHSSAGGYEGFGAYTFDGFNDHITANLPTIGQSGFTIEFRANPRSNFSQANLSGDMCAVDTGVARVCFNRDGYAEASVVGKGTAYAGFEGSATIYTLTVWNGTLYFTHTQNGTIYRYDGLTSWTQVGMLSQASSGTTGLALNVWNNTLYAGEVNTSDARVFRYDGDTTWTPVGKPVSASNIAVVVLTAWNGSLYAGVDNGSIARYDGGTTWTWIGLGATADGGIGSLNVWNNTLYAGTSTAGRIYRYLSDTTWEDMGHPGVAGSVGVLVVFNGTLYTGTGNTTPPVNASVFRYDAGTDANWTWIRQVDAGSSSLIRSMAVWNGSLYAGTNSGGRLYVYDNANSFDAVGTMLASDVRAMAVFNSSLFIGTGTSGFVYRHGNGTSLRSTGKLWENVYHHIVVVRDTTQIALYIDGVLNASIGLSDYLPAMKNPIQIGRGWGSSSSGGISGLDYNGNIDDFRIYSRALSANQIFALFTNRTDIIASDETDGNEVWQACVTPNDGIENGNTVCTNSLTITGLATSSSSVTSTEAAAAETATTIAPEYTYSYTPYTSPYAGYSFAEIMAIMQSMYIPPPYTPPTYYTAPQTVQQAYQPVTTVPVSISMTNQWTRPVSNLQIAATAPTQALRSMYTSKVVAPRFGAFGISSQAVDARAISVSFAEAVQVGELRPGETFTGTVQVQVPLATSTSVPVQIVYSTFGQEIATREITVDVVPKIFASAIDVKRDQNAMNLYTVVSNPTDDPAQAFAAREAERTQVYQEIIAAVSPDELRQALEHHYQTFASEQRAPDFAVIRAAREQAARETRDQVIRPAMEEYIRRAREYAKERELRADQAFSQFISNEAQFVAGPDASEAAVAEFAATLREQTEQAAQDIIIERVKPDVQAVAELGDLKLMFRTVAREAAERRGISSDEDFAALIASDIRVKIAVQYATRKALREAAQQANRFGFSEHATEGAALGLAEASAKQAVEEAFEMALTEVLGHKIAHDVMDRTVASVALAIPPETIKDALREAPSEEIRDAAKARLQAGFTDIIKGLPVHKGDELRGWPPTKNDFSEILRPVVEGQVSEIIDDAARTAIHEEAPESATKEIFQDAAREAAARAIDQAVGESVADALEALVPISAVDGAVGRRFPDNRITHIIGSAIDKAKEKDSVEGLPSRRRDVLSVRREIDGREEQKDAAVAPDEREKAAPPTWNEEGEEIKEELRKRAKDTLPADDIAEAVSDVVKRATSDAAGKVAAETIAEAVKEVIKTGTDTDAINGALDGLLEVVKDEDIQKAAEAVVEDARARGLAEKDVQDIAEEAVREAVVETVKETIDGEIKDAHQETVQNIIDEALPESELKEAAKEVVDETIDSGAIEEAVKDAMKEKAKEDVKKEVKNSVQDIVKEAVKDALVEGADKETVKGSVNEAAKEFIKEAVEGVVEKVGEEAFAADAEKEVRQGVKEAIEEAAQEVVKEVPTENVVKEAIDAVVKDITANVVGETLAGTAIKGEVKKTVNSEVLSESITAAITGLSEAGANEVANRIVKDAVTEKRITESARTLARTILTEDTIGAAAEAATTEAIVKRVPLPLIQDAVEEGVKKASEEAVRETIQEVTAKVVGDTIRGIIKSAVLPFSLTVRIEGAVRDQMDKISVQDNIRETVQNVVADHKKRIATAVENKKEQAALDGISSDEVQEAIKNAAKKTFLKESIREAAKETVKREVGGALYEAIVQAAKKAMPVDIIRFAADNALRNALRRMRSGIQLEAPEIQRAEAQPFLGGALTGAVIAQDMMGLSAPERTVREAIRRVVDDGVPEEAIRASVEAAVREAAGQRVLQDAINNIVREHFPKEDVEGIIIDAISEAAEVTVREAVIEAVTREIWENVRLIIDTAVPEETIRKATEEVIEEAIVNALPEPSLKKVIDDALNPLKPQDLTLEMTVKKSASNNYDPSFGLAGFFESLTNGPRAVSAEVLGPYPLKQNERFLLGQQFTYPPHLIGEYDVELIYRKGDVVLGKQSHKLDLKRECNQDADCPQGYRCSEGLCTEAEQMNIWQLIGRGLALATVLSALMLCGYSVLTYARRKKSAALRQLQEEYDRIVATFISKEFGRAVPPKTKQQRDYRERIGRLLPFLQQRPHKAQPGVKRTEEEIINEKAALIQFVQHHPQRKSKEKIKIYNKIICTFIRRSLDQDFSKEQIAAALIRRGLDRKLVQVYIDFVLRTRR